LLMSQPAQYRAAHPEPCHGKDGGDPKAIQHM
jgi:hypothetical protein